MRLDPYGVPSTDFFSPAHLLLDLANTCHDDWKSPSQSIVVSWVAPLGPEGCDGDWKKKLIDTTFTHEKAVWFRMFS